MNKLIHYVQDIDSFVWSDETPFSSIYYPVFGSVGYLAFLYFGKKFMSNRKEYSLRTVSACHDILMIGLSLSMLFGTLRGAWRQYHQEGLLSLFCETSEHAVKGSIGFWLYIFYISKFLELFDTVILVLKKKPTIFLHVYHHAVMVYSTWFWLEYQWLSAAWWCCWVNSLVHAFMYYYYLQTSLNKKVWWKKYITVGQLVQFFSGLLVVQFWFYLRESHQCKGSYPIAVISNGVNISFILLFGNFFQITYKEKSKSV